MPARRKIENRIRRIGRRRQKKRQQHHACLGASLPPRAEQQNRHQPAEQNLRRHREDLIRQHQVDQTNEGQDQHSDLHAPHKLARSRPGEVENKLQRNGHEDAAVKRRKYPVEGGGNNRKSKGSLGRTFQPDRQAQQRKPEILRMMTLRQVEKSAKNRNTKEQKCHQQR